MENLCLKDLLSFCDILDPPDRSRRLERGSPVDGNGEMEMGVGMKSGMGMGEEWEYGENVKMKVDEVTDIFASILSFCTLVIC